MADLLQVLMNNWPGTLALLLGISGGLIEWVRNIAASPPVYIGGGVFLFSLWTVIGFCTLYDRRHPRLMKPYLDYRYGLTLEGLVPNWMPENTPFAAQRGMLGLGIQFRNFSPGPIKYTLETTEVQIGTRTIPKYARNSLSGHVARGGGKILRAVAFPSDSLKEFYGKGETKGVLEYAITYGSPDVPPVRRLRVRVELIFIFPDKGIHDPKHGMGLGFSENIIVEDDEPI